MGERGSIFEKFLIGLDELCIESKDISWSNLLNVWWMRP
jgi:hypothetical protein